MTYKATSHHNTYFLKKTYNLPTFIKDIGQLFSNIPKIRDTMKKKRISHAFQERIMLAITAVNGCTYCSWQHTKTALESGCTDEEIEDILCLDFSKVDPKEAVALAFSQHYAEMDRNPSKKSIKRLLEYYGKEKAQDILLSIQMIFFGNLLGNTVDAFLSRLDGKPPKNGSILLETLIFFFGGYWIRKIMKIDQKNM